MFDISCTLDFCLSGRGGGGGWEHGAGKGCEG